MMEFDVKIEAGDLYDYMLRHSYNSPAGILGSCFGALFIVFAMMSKQWLYLVFGAILLVYLPWSLFLKSRQQVVNNPSFKKPLHYVLDEQGITISQGEDSVQYLWEELHKAVSTGRSIILYTSAVNATIFPKRQLEDNITDVIRMISTHMPPGKVKIRS
ncbi:MAG: YcxB family protein [Acetatifactor sp.]